jgi:DNA processing protein
MRVEERTADWSVLAREAMRDGGLADLWSGRVEERSQAGRETQEILRRGLRDVGPWEDRVDTEFQVASEFGARLVTVLDDDYPVNLRLIFNLPPFLFLRGKAWTDSDARSVAVVGTRKPSVKGLDRASRLASLLVASGVVVISGLARGIDTAAHTACLNADARTIAVMGTGISKTYPPENQSLADRIVETGVLVSQFWPSTGPARWTFPRRNVTMSGIAQGTVVVEASATSGAKMQARLALEHGKKVFLLHSLATSQAWARNYIEKRGAREVASVEEIVRQLASPDRIRDVAVARQLTLDLA